MIYDFDTTHSRKNTFSAKWSSKEDLIPMWVADMDFTTAPEIIEALSQTVNHGIFGYSIAPPEFYEAIKDWWKTQHNVIISEDWIVPTTGVLPALSAIIRALTQPGDQIIVQSPVYNHFYITLEQVGAKVIENPLSQHNGDYEIDFEDLEAKAADPKTKMLIMSNPHNPVGKVWTKEDLEKVGKICTEHGVIIISDEIHSDLILGNNKHTAFSSFTQFANSLITCSSPSKTFNLAGIQVAYLFTANEEFRAKIKKVFLQQETELLSPFAISALISAYTKGENWMKALIKYLENNYAFLRSFITLNLPNVKVAELQATYLVWLDCRFLNLPSKEIIDILKSKYGLWLNGGNTYGSGGDGFIRINIACPQSTLESGLQKLQEFYKDHI